MLYTSSLPLMFCLASCGNVIHVIEQQHIPLGTHNPSEHLEVWSEFYRCMQKHMDKNCDLTLTSGIVLRLQKRPGSNLCYNNYHYITVSHTKTHHTWCSGTAPILLYLNSKLHALQQTFSPCIVYSCFCNSDCLTISPLIVPSVSYLFK